jgi:hypothetical protein
MPIFLLCGVLLTLGWGGVTALTMIALKIGLIRTSLGTAQPAISMKYGAGLSVDVSTSTNDLKPPAHVKRNMTER